MHSPLVLMPNSLHLLVKMTVQPLLVFLQRHTSEYSSTTVLSVGSSSPLSTNSQSTQPLSTILTLLTNSLIQIIRTYRTIQIIMILIKITRNI